jgi:hypothetical protein
MKNDIKQNEKYDLKRNCPSKSKQKYISYEKRKQTILDSLRKCVCVCVAPVSFYNVVKTTTTDFVTMMI